MWLKIINRHYHVTLAILLQHASPVLQGTKDSPSPADVAPPALAPLGPGRLGPRENILATAIHGLSSSAPAPGGGGLLEGRQCRRAVRTPETP